MPTPEGFPFSHRIQVRFRDCDPRGHVNNAVYFTYFEECRLALWRHLSGSEGLPSTTTILAHAECDFRAPAFVGDLIDVRVKVEDVGRSSIKLLYEIVNVKTGQRLADSRAVLVTFDYATQQSTPVPDDVRGLLAGIMGAP